MKKNILFKISIILFCCFFIALPSAISALEITYPQTATGTTVTDSSGLAEYLAYIFDFGIAIGIAVALLTLVVSSIFYFVAPAVPGALEIAKDRISGAISGLLILLLAYLIIITINPSLATFKINPLEKIDNPVVNSTTYGVSFYKAGGCSDTPKTYTSSTYDLGDLKNKTNGVKITQNSDGDVYFISILYDNPNYWGKCQYVDPNNSGCQSVDITAASASIYVYDFSPSGGGSVTLYRESFNMVSGKEANKDGGYLKLTQSDIGGLYEVKLSNLKFTGTTGSSNCTVPEPDRVCVKWDDNGKCTQRQCPTLEGESISSIKIDGNYIVLLLYEAPSEEGGLIASYCQAFPTKDEVNKDGPQQVKWDAIRTSGYKPNYILIIPIQSK